MPTRKLTKAEALVFGALEDRAAATERVLENIDQQIEKHHAEVARLEGQSAKLLEAVAVERASMLELLGCPTSDVLVMRDDKGIVVSWEDGAKAEPPREAVDPPEIVVSWEDGAKAEPPREAVDPPELPASALPQPGRAERRRADRAAKRAAKRPRAKATKAEGTADA